LIEDSTIGFDHPLFPSTFVMENTSDLGEIAFIEFYELSIVAPA